MAASTDSSSEYHLSFSSSAHSRKTPLACPVALRTRTRNQNLHINLGKLDSQRNNDDDEQSSHNGNSNKPDSYGYLIPRKDWLPDSAASACMHSDECNAKFPPAKDTALFGGFANIIAIPFTSRRHHCRACGKVFCAQHSANTLPLLAVGRDAILEARGAATPGIGSQTPFSPALSTFGASSSRNGSTTPSYFTPPAHPSGAISPTISISSASTNNYTKPASAQSAQAKQIIEARVCDMCFLSLSLGANLSLPPQIMSATISPPVSRRGLSQTSSAHESPSQSQILVHSDTAASSMSSSAATSSGRLRQTSAESFDTQVTTPPSSSSPNTACHSTLSSPQHQHDKAGMQRRRSLSPAVATNIASQAMSRDSSHSRSSGSFSDSFVAEQRDRLGDLRGQPTHKRATPMPTGYSSRGTRSHPLDPRHMRLSQEEESGGSNPDSSLEGTIPSTPGAGWTWST